MTSSVYVYKSALKRFLVRVFDFLGSVIFFPVRLKMRHFDPARIQKILVIRLDHIGDLVLTLPALAALRAKYPEAQIDWLIPAEYEKLFRDNPQNIKLIPFAHNWFSRDFKITKMYASVGNLISDLRAKQYDLAVDFRGDLRNILLMFAGGITWRFGYGITGGRFLLTHCAMYPTGTHQIEVNLALLEPLNTGSSFKLQPFTFAPETREALQLSFPALFEDDDLIMIHPAGGYADKVWSFKNFKTLIGKLLAENRKLLLIGTSKEKENNPFEVPANTHVFDLRGKINLHELPILMKQCQLFIGCDSGPAHIAACQGIPMICIFSDMNPVNVWKPLSDKARLIHGNIHQITVDQVFNTVKEMLNSEAYDV